MAKLSKEAKGFRDRRKAITLKLNALGFDGYLIPRKHHKMSYKGVMISDATTWNNWDRKSGVTIYNSEALSIFMGTEYVSVDIDYPGALDVELLAILKQNPTFMSWHGERSPLDGGKGAFIYKTSKTNPNYKRYCRSLVRTDKRLFTHGYELLRGYTSQMCYGVHHDTEWYEHNDLNVVELPDELFAYVKAGGELKKPRKKSDERVTLSNDSDDIEKFFVAVQKLCSARGINLSIEVDEIRPDETCLLKAFGDDGDGHQCALYINKDGTVIMRSNQPNFQAKLPMMSELALLDLPVVVKNKVVEPKFKTPTRKLKKTKKKMARENGEPVPTLKKKRTLKKKKKKVEKTRKKFEAPVDNTKLKDLFFANRVVGISAGTGAGKSYTSRETILEWLYDSPANKAIYFTSDNKNATAMAEQFDNDDESIFQMSGDTSNNWNKYKESTRLVITNQQYIARKSFADKNHYAVMSWIDSNTLVIIDEADMLFNKMKYEQPLMFRYDAHNFNEMDEYEPVQTHQRCPSGVQKAYKCDVCSLSKKMAIRKPTRGRYAKVEQFVSHGLYRRDFDSSAGWLDVASDIHRGNKLGEEVELHSSRQISLKAKQVLLKNESYMNARPLTCKNDVTPFDSMEDLLRCSHDAFLMTNDFPEEVVNRKRDEIAEQFKGANNNIAKTNKELKKWMTENNIQFPHSVCNVPVLKCFDMSGLRTIANRAARVVILSATYSLQQVEYFNDAIPGIQWQEYKGDTFKAIQDLMIITTDEDFGESSGQFRFSKEVRNEDGEKVMIADIITRDSMNYLDAIARVEDKVNYAGRTLLVQPSSFIGSSTQTSRLLSRDDNRIENFNSGAYMTMRSADKVVPNTLTYSRSALARGMNLGDYDRCITEGEAFQPADSYNWQSNGTRELEKLQTEEKVRLLLQSIGRIMRAPVIYNDGHEGVEPILRRKVITIYNCGEAFGAHIADRLSALCVNKPKTAHVPIFWEGEGKSTFPALSSFSAINRVLQHEHHWLKKGFPAITDFCEYHSDSELMQRPWSRLPVEAQRRIGTKENFNNLKNKLKELEQ